MPSPAPTWKEIADFSPGISDLISPNHQPGTAQATGTRNCYADTAGALRPFPRLVGTVTLGDENLLEISPASRLNESWRICGLYERGPVLPTVSSAGESTASELFVGLEMWKADPFDLTNDQRTLQVLRYRFNRGTGADWQNVDTVTYTDVPWEQRTRGMFHMEKGRSNSADPTTAGPAIVMWSFGPYVKSWPDDTTPGGSTAVAAPGSALIGAEPEIVFHQGRLVVFAQYGSDTGTGQQWTTNEQLYWCSVNDVTTLDPLLGGYLDVLPSLDHPSGFTVMESLTADELFCVKQDGGAITLRGDLNDFTLTNYPYVKSTGSTRCRGVVTPIGAIYPSTYGGVWVWDGAQISKKISDKLTNEFWMPPASTESDGAAGFGATYGTTWCQWGDWVMLPFGWVFDLTNNGWFRFDDPDLRDIYHLANSYDDKYLFASPRQFGDDIADTETDPMIWVYSTTATPGYNYEWTSQPLAETLERMVSLQEVVLVLSGSGTVEFTAYTAQDPTGVTVSFDVTGAEDKPVYFRKRVPVTGTHLVFNLEAYGATENDAAPTLHKIRYGVIPADEIPNTDVSAA